MNSDRVQTDGRFFHEPRDFFSLKSPRAIVDSARDDFFPGDEAADGSGLSFFWGPVGDEKAIFWAKFRATIESPSVGLTDGLDA